MSGFGKALIAAGFLWGALLSVQTPADEVSWGWYVTALALGIGGVVIVRSRGRAGVPTAATRTHGVEHLGQILRQLSGNVRSLQAEPGDLDTLHTRIDALLLDDLTEFADMRSAMVPRFGLAGYARVMNEFASGERCLNRVWSASVDGYIDEAHAYLTRAQEQFEAAESAFEALMRERA